MTDGCDRIGEYEELGFRVEDKTDPVCHEAVRQAAAGFPLFLGLSACVGDEKRDAVEAGCGHYEHITLIP